MSDTVKITLLEQEKTTVLEMQQGENLLRLLLKELEQRGLKGISPCAGGGKCGRCRVRFVQQAPLPTPAERALLEPQELREGIRLACLTKPVKDCTLDPAPLLEQAKRLQTYDIATRCTVKPTPNRQAMPEPPAYLLALDLGTTTLAAALYEKASGEALAYGAALNPQRRFGADVVSRMQAALESPQKAHELEHCVKEQLQKLVEELLQKAQERLGAKELSGQVRLVLSANTTMLHLFLGLSVETLARAPFTPMTLAPEPMEFCGLPLEIVPGISAFVGGDITAGILACGMLEKNAPEQLFLDLGTNAEMVYRDREGRLTATAAAAGSAFEGQSEKSLYGSEAVQELARLFKSGQIDSNGTYYGTAQQTLSQEEIRGLQLAKAAVRAGMELLDGGKCPDRLWLAGGFGRKLRLEDGICIGLFPKKAQGRLQAVGNTALLGAYLYGCMPDRRELDRQLAQIRSCNLAEEAEFQRLLIQYCNF